MRTQALKFVDDFIAKLQNQRRLSIHTLKSYQRDLNNFIGFCDQHSIDDWPQINQTQLRAHISSRHRHGLSGTSLQRELSAIRTFFNYLLIEGILKTNPAKGVKAPKSARKLPTTLDTEQAAGLMQIETSNPLAIRDKAILELFYSSGLRLTELVELDLEDIDLNAGIVQVLGKGKKMRVLPVGQHAISAILDWLDVRPQFVSPEQTALFVSQQGNRLSQRNIQKRVQQWGIKQGVDLRIHPHLLRHSFASHLLESSSNLRAVQELLGHANISTTQIYTHLDFQHLAKVYDKTHPRAKKK